MKKNKIIILIISIIVITWIGLLIYFYKEKINLEKEKTPQVLIINSNYFWKYELGEWAMISMEKDIDLYNWKKFDIYIDNKFYNTYKYVFTNGKGYFFDDNDKSQHIQDNNVLLNNNSFLSINDYTKVSINDNDNKIISNFLKKYDINYNEVTTKEKYSIDKNNSIYIISNYYVGIDYKQTYYFVFYRHNSKNYFIAKGDYEHDYDLHIVLDIDKKLPNIVLEYYLENVNDYKMFQYDGSQYKEVTNFEEIII